MPWEPDLVRDGSLAAVYVRTLVPVPTGDVRAGGAGALAWVLHRMDYSSKSWSWGTPGTPQSPRVRASVDSSPLGL